MEYAIFQPKEDITADVRCVFIRDPRKVARTPAARTHGTAELAKR
eukprot:SAG31_NODE_38072_length_299_cov_0.775000_1_plen_44_part_01